MSGCAGQRKNLASAVSVTKLSWNEQDLSSIQLVRRSPERKASETLTVTSGQATITRAGVSYKPRAISLEASEFSRLAHLALSAAFPQASAQGNLIQELVFTKVTGESQSIMLEQVMTGTVQELYQSLMAIRKNVLNEGKPVE